MLLDAGARWDLRDDLLRSTAPGLGVPMGPGGDGLSADFTRRSGERAGDGSLGHAARLDN